jgi:pyruvate/oxaloacetate carboxyltransferase
MHQVPGGMISNLVSQLREANALDRINEVYEELPSPQGAGHRRWSLLPADSVIQAVQNVLFGRYKVVSAQVKDYVYGLYGGRRGRLTLKPEAGTQGL